MNANIAEVSCGLVNADVHDIKVIFVDEADDSNPLGIKGVGEIGIVGVAAAIVANVRSITRRERARPRFADHRWPSCGADADPQRRAAGAEGRPMAYD